MSSFSRAAFNRDEDRPGRSTAGPLTAACVAVVLYAAGATTGWLNSGAHLDGLGTVALSAVVVFAIAVAIRAMNAWMLRDRPGAIRSVMADLGVCIAALVFIGVVGSLNDSSGIALYSVVTSAAFVIPAAAVISSIAELVIRSRRLTAGAVVLAALVGVGALAVSAATAFWV